MNFTKSQVLSMYGSQFFIVENETADAPITEEPVTEETVEAPVIEEPVTEKTVEAPLLGEPILSTSKEVGGGSQNSVAEDPVIPPPTNTLASLEQKIKPQKPAPPTPKSPISWKMRKTATVALVMAEKEFSNKMMTMALKNCVEAAGVSTAAIGFGVMAGDSHLWDFSDMPVPVAVVFGEGEKQETPEGKTLHQVDSLSDIVLNPDKQNTLISLLQKIIP